MGAMKKLYYARGAGSKGATGKLARHQFDLQKRLVDQVLPPVSKKKKA